MAPCILIPKPSDTASGDVHVITALLDSTSKVCSAFSFFRSLFCWTLPSSGDVLFEILIRNKQRDPHRIRTLFNFRKLYFEVFPMCIMLCICGFTFFSSVLVGIQLMKMLISLFPADAFSPATSKSVMWELKPCVPNVHRLFSCWIAWEASSVYSRCRDSHVDPWFLGSTTWYFLVLHSNLNGLKSFAVRYLYSYLPKKCRRGAVSQRYQTMAKYFVACVQHQQFVNLISGFSVIFWVFQVAGNPEISKPRNL